MKNTKSIILIPHTLTQKDEATLKAYAPHPIHQEFIKLLSDVREDTPICLDWLVPGPESKI